MPIDVEQQIHSGVLVCPKTRQRLVIQGDLLVTLDDRHEYSRVNGVPVLIDSSAQNSYLSQNEQHMVLEYCSASDTAVDGTGKSRRWFEKLWEPIRRRALNPEDDYRSRKSIEAWQIVSNQPEGALCISVGGGPGRCHPEFVNVNIGPFPNVDVVADAYSLPYRDSTVAAIFCEAVLEHLEFPDLAVKEMHRVLIPGGQVFAATPFLQTYHGYPNHFQNFTLTGHERLFARNGFELLSSGACVGPTYVVSDLVQNYVRSYIPLPLLKRPLLVAMTYFFGLIRRLDRKVATFTNAPDMASTTYVHGKKAG